MITLKEFLHSSQTRLAPYSESPHLDAEVLIAHGLSQSKTFLYSHSETSLSIEQEQALVALIDRRCEGHPVAYITGHREFWSMDLQVSPATLIPRPETEGLVEACLARGDRHASRRVLDLGTGTGAIALALARECPSWTIVATDLSEQALAIARLNAKSLGLERVEWRLSDWFQDLPPARYDVIVSNPPYIAEQDPHLSQGDVRFEPRSALVAGDHGYADCCHIIEHAPRFLNAGGWLLLEHGHDQAARLGEAFHQAGFVKISHLKDLQGLARLTCAKIR